MTEEEDKPKSKKEETALSFLEQAKAERIELEKTRAETAKLVERLEQLKAEDVLSGRVPHVKAEPKPKMSNKEYAESISKGIVPTEK